MPSSPSPQFLIIDPLWRGASGADAWWIASTISGNTACRLAFGRTNIESHGGRLWAAPRSPHGSIHCVQLPGDTSGGEMVDRRVQ
jgi:hypothetical protein